MVNYRVLSITLTKAEKNYSATERECLSIVWAIQTLRPYIDGQHFLVRSDHSALKWLLSLKDPAGRLALWCQRLSTYNYEIIHRPGRKHQVPDAISRLISIHTDSEDGNLVPIDDEIPMFGEPVQVVETRRMKKANTDPEVNDIRDSSAEVDEPPSSQYGVHESITEPRADTLSPAEMDAQDAAELGRDVDAIDIAMMDALNLGTDRDEIEELPEEVEKRTASRNTDHLLSPITLSEFVDAQRFDDFCQTIAKRTSSNPLFLEGGDGVLRRKHLSEPNVSQIVVPEASCARLCHMAHHPVIAAHPGHTRMNETLRRTYCWPSMASEIMMTVRSFTHCAKNRIRLLKKSNPMKLFPATTRIDRNGLTWTTTTVEDR